MPRAFGAFVLAALFACACACGDAADGDRQTEPARGVAQAASTTATSTHLRVVAANLSSGARQSYDSGEGARILQALAPDVVLIQEFNFGANDDDALRSFVADTFGADFSYAREPGRRQIPNGVISRYPITESGAWDDPMTTSRELAWARIDVPGPRDLYAISVHLLTSSASTRGGQCTALAQHVRTRVPSDAYVVLGGDLNTGNRNEVCVQTLSSLFATGAPYPADSNGNTGTNAARTRPYDWVLAGPSLEARKQSVVLGGRVFAAGLVFDSRVFSPVAPPAQRGDSAAQNMQHMAVVRDFDLPWAAPD